MPTDLEDLVEFLHHGNTPVRQQAVDGLVPYSEKQPSIFKRHQLAPVRDLKLLVKDYTLIAKNTLTILINISNDPEILELLAEDDKFLETLLLRMMNSKEPTANLISMLLANLAKSPSLQRILYLTRSLPPSTLSTSTLAIDQLLDLFVKENYNPDADYDHLAYLFADLAKYPEGTKYLTTLKSYDNLFPISKLLPFTEVGSLARRLGVASAIKNVAFTIPIHAILMAEPLEILPHILLPLASGADTYTEKETEELPLELQLLDPSVKREDDFNVLKTHLETLLLLTTTKEVREELREKGVYYVIRECHLAVEDEEVREACDRLVQVLMRDDALEDDVQVEIKKGVQAIEDGRRKEESEDEDDDKIVEIF